MKNLLLRLRILIFLFAYRHSNKPKELNIVVNGKETTVEVVNINGSNFVPIRSIDVATGAFDVNYGDGKIIVKIAE